MAQSFLSLSTPEEVARQLATRLKELRLRAGYTRATLAERAGVTAASLRRFERTGLGAFALVLKIAFALGRLDECERLFPPPSARSVEELERLETAPAPQRGRR